MFDMLKRLARPLLQLAILGALAGAAFPATAGAVTVGISDQTTSLFTQPRFQNINITVGRYFAPWNTAVERNRSDLNHARAWIKAAVAGGVQPMISFGGNGNYIPSVSQYSSAIRAFIRDFPQVKTYAAWNEPDWIYRPQLARNPGLAASYFNALVKDCRRCTDVAGEVYLPANQLGSYLRAYIRGLHYRPAAWALHNYYDVRSHTTSQLRVMERYVGSRPIWLTEIAGIERRGHWQYRNQSVFGAGKDESFLFSLSKRFHNVTRIYHYQWQGTVDTKNTGWDSGLIGPQGVPRPAYWVVAKAAGPRHATRRRR